MIFYKLRNSKFAKNVSGVFGVKSLMLILGMVSSIVSARVLGPDGKGIFAVAAALTGMGVQFGNLGMHASNTYFLAQNREELPAIVGNSIAITLLVTLLAGGVLFVVSFFPNLIKINGLLLLLSFVYIPIQLYNMYQQNYFVALEEIKQYSVIEMLNGSIYPILLLIVASLRKWTLSPELAVIISMISALVVLAVGGFLLKKELKSRIHFDRGLLKKALPYGFKSYLSCLLTYLVLRVDVLMLDALLDKTHTGLYSLAVNLADIVNMIAVSVSMLLFPKLSGMSKKEEKANFMIKTLKYMSLIMAVLVIGATIFSKIAVLLVYGEAYRASVPVFRILMPGIFFWALCSLLFNYYSSENKIGINIITSLIGLCINLLLNAMFIPRYGINGAAAASTVSYIIIFCLLIYYLRKIGVVKKDAKET